jgi:signal transduction histidine kinase
VIADLCRVVYAQRPRGDAGSPVGRSALDEVGLVAALGQAGEAAAEGVLEFEFEHPHELPPLPAAVEVAAYRITQEALTNVVRHARTRRCMLRLAMGSDGLVVEVTDDGSGIAPDAPPGIGLSSMRERAEELGGRLDMASTEGGGTRLVALLPCSGEA